jgi:hypothetical protein
MKNPAVAGFNICINGLHHTFRDTQPAAYEAALIRKKRTCRLP